ncbi:hypothetical protein [Rickettsia tamurae]|uniref:Uncharacterized protein n=2 Tax=spotted fever group TaxID=114277 RepID=A0A8E0WMH5_9RICK|nr:hypothetical protein [Rickettsia tamurae]KDO03356.1 hypothetical protein REISMN_02185 [Rickettsia tamurae subsp. buchneri]
MVIYLLNLSRNVNSQIGTTTGEYTSLRATVPVSDMVEFISSALKPQQASAFSAGEEELTAKQQEELKRQEEERLQEILDEPGVEPVYPEMLVLSLISAPFRLVKSLYGLFKDQIIDLVSDSYKDKAIKLSREIDNNTIDVSNNITKLQKHIEDITGVKLDNLELEKYGKYLEEYEIWVQLPEIVKKIPEKLGFPKFSEKGTGLLYGDKVNGMRIMKGRSNVEFSHQKVDYAVIVDKGCRIDKYGNQLRYNSNTKVTEVIDPVSNKIIKEIPGFKLKKIPEAHINLEEWIKKWITHNKP